MITPVLALEHYVTYFSLLNSDLPIYWKTILLVMILAAWRICIDQWHQTNRIRRVIEPMLMLLLVFICSFGLCPYFLGDSIFQARCMYGCGIYVSLLALIVTTDLKACDAERLPSCLKGIDALAVCAVSWICMVFAASYGNALYEQNYYVEKRLTALIDDLKDCEALTSGAVTNVQITGSIGYAPILRGGGQVSEREGHSYVGLISNERGDWQLVQRLMPEILSDAGKTWPNFILYYYCGLPIEQDLQVDLTQENLPLLIDNVYETIWGDEDSILIELKDYDLQLSM